MTTLNIGQLARQTGVTVETVRFYEKQGLIAAPQRSAAGYRQYPRETIQRLRFIQNAKDVGFTLKDIGELLALREEPGTTCEDIQLRASDKLMEVEQKLRELTQIRNALARLVTKCKVQAVEGECPILAELDNEERNT
ncbi:MAG: heavy metal-responsive transcriptional regulator [Gammaproteobacteria bacterium]